MDESLHSPTGEHISPTAQIGLPDLPEGRRYADYEPWDRTAVRRRRLLALVAAMLVIALALVIGLSAWNGARHYARGVRALHSGDYARAAGQFAAARVLGFWYRDALSLEQRAWDAGDAKDDTSSALLRQARDRNVLVELDRAAAALKAGEVTRALAALDAIDASALRSARSEDETVRTSATALEQALAAGARTALHAARWARAGRLAAALLVLKPLSLDAASLTGRAQAGQTLQAKLDKARDAARHRKWRQALDLALGVLAEQKGFPGASAVVADARRALAPKPKRTSSSTASTSTTPSASSGSSGGGTSSQPAPP